MPQRSMTYETARCPICRYGVCPRSHNASIIEFSKCVRRHLAAFLYVLTEPSLLLARLLLYGYVLSRLLHFAAYFTAQTHETRATFWTVGSLIIIFMAARTLVAAL